MKYKILFIVLLLILTSCGGGGGGGGGGSTAGNDSRGLRILHGAFDTPPVTIQISEGNSYNAAFRGESAYRSLPSDIGSVVGHRANNPLAVLFQDAVISDGETKQTLLVYGLEGDGSFRTKVHTDAFPEVQDGMAAVRLVHAVSGAGSVSGVVGVTDVPSVGLGGFSDYVFIPVGELGFSVTESGDGGPFVSGTQLFEEKKFYTLFVTGEDAVFSTFKVYTDN